MNKTIFLCSSMNFYKHLVDVERQLEKRGFIIKLPMSAGIMKEKNDFEVSHFKDVFTHGEKAEFIQKNFKEIEKGDSILVINDEKNGIKGYIGANVLIEIGVAFFLKKKIYILNPVDETLPYREELLAFHVAFINGDLKKIQ